MPNSVTLPKMKMMSETLHAKNPGDVCSWVFLAFSCDYFAAGVEEMTASINP